MIGHVEGVGLRRLGRGESLRRGDVLMGRWAIGFDARGTRAACRPKGGCGALGNVTPKGTRAACRPVER